MRYADCSAPLMFSFTGRLIHESAGSGTSTQLGASIISQVSLAGLISQGAAAPAKARPKQQHNNTIILFILEVYSFTQRVGTALDVYELAVLPTGLSLLSISTCVILSFKPSSTTVTDQLVVVAYEPE